MCIRDREYAIPNKTDFEKFFVSSLPNSFSIFVITASAIGSIITAVAVFEIHIDRKAPENINPNKIEFAVPPNIEIIFRAIRLCNPQFSMAIASINPPINRKITEFIYDPEISEPDKTPSSGKKTNGTNDVAAIGKASVIHQIAIRTATAATLPTFGF